jgi:hypothetical protein
LERLLAFEGIEVRSHGVTEPTLEDVFIDLVGAEVKDRV